MFATEDDPPVPCFPNCRRLTFRPFLASSARISCSDLPERVANTDSRGLALPKGLDCADICMRCHVKLTRQHYTQHVTYKHVTSLATPMPGTSVSGAWQCLVRDMTGGCCRRPTGATTRSRTNLRTVCPVQVGASCRLRVSWLKLQSASLAHVCRRISVGTDICLEVPPTEVLKRTLQVPGEHAVHSAQSIPLATSARPYACTLLVHALVTCWSQPLYAMPLICSDRCCCARV